jgi:hypothetical protein
MKAGTLTDKERRELATLQRKWATRKATTRQIHRCLELERRYAHAAAEAAADRMYASAYAVSLATVRAGLTEAA